MVYVFSAAVGYDLDNALFLKTLQQRTPDAHITLMRDAEQYEPHIARLFASYKWAKQLPSGSNCVLSDFRDVLFQKDLNYFPFDRPGIFFESRLYKDETYNKKWIERDYGRGFLEYIWNKPITCCGVVTGKKEFIVEYLKYCCGEMLSLPKIEHGAITSVHAKFVFDKNMLFYSDNERSPVYTVGLKDYIRIGNRTIYNDNLDIPFIIHQYDRHLGDQTRKGSDNDI